MGSSGAQGGRDIRFALGHIFIVCKANLLPTPHFFHFRIINYFVIAQEEFFNFN